MKQRKFEFWKYDATMCVEATSHLNEMSLKGYELVGISHYFSLAAYVKTDTASTKNYSVIINDTESEIDDNNLVFINSKEGISIYCGKDELPKYDDEEAFNNLKTNLLRINVRRKPNSERGLYFLLLPAGYSLYYDISTYNLADIWPSLLLNTAFILVILFVGFRNRMKVKSTFMLQGFVSFENFKYEKVKIYKQHFAATPYMLLALLALTIASCVYLGITSSNPLVLISILIAIIGITMIVTSIYFALIKRNIDYEKGFALLGAILVFLSILFSNSLLGVVIVIMGSLILFL